jgi:hypothetical protein
MKIPKVGVIASITKNMKLKIIKIRPAIFMGNVCKPKNARIKEIVPTTPGIPKPG